MVNGLGSARDVAPAGLVFVPVVVAAFPEHPAASRARPAAAAAAARRLVIRSMVPPVCRNVTMDDRAPRSGRHRGCPQAGTVASTDHSGGSGESVLATMRSGAISATI